MPPVDHPPKSRPRASWVRKLPLLVILVAAVIGAVTLRDTFSIETLAEHRDTLLAFRDAHYLWAVLGFLLAYVAVVALSLPGATVATLIGGFLFGLFPGVLYNVLAAGTGAILVFLSARAGFGESLAARIAAAGGKTARLQEALQQNEWSVLLIMRLVPAVPLFLANLLPAFVGTRLWPFAVTTFFGIMPGAMVYTWVGAGLGEVFARGETPDLSIIFQPYVIGPILGLAALSALPIVVKAFQRRG